MTNESNSTSALQHERQKLELGRMAADLLNNPLFPILSDIVLRDTIQAIDAAKPEHVKEVMWQKQKRQVWAELLANLRTLVEQAELVYAQMQERNNPEAIEKRRLDEQGFGLNFGPEEGVS